MGRVFGERGGEEEGGGERKKVFFSIIDADTVNINLSDTVIVVIPTPSQTTNVLLKAKPASPTVTFIMAVACHTLLYRVRYLILLLPGSLNAKNMLPTQTKRS